MQRLGQLSPDGSKYWDSQQWVSAISRDGNWRWNGRSWDPIPSADQTNPPANVLAAVAAGSGFFHFRGIKGGAQSMATVVVALLLLQLVMSVAAFELGVRSTGLQRQIATLPGGSELVARAATSSDYIPFAITHSRGGSYASTKASSTITTANANAITNAITNAATDLWRAT